MNKMLTVGMISGLFLMAGCQANETQPVEESDIKVIENMPADEEIKLPSLEPEKEETKYDMTVEEFLPIIEKHYMELDNVLKVEVNSIKCADIEGDYCTDTGVAVIKVDVTFDFESSIDYADSIYYTRNETDKIEILKGFVEQNNTTLNTLYEKTGFDDGFVFSIYAKDNTAILSISSDVNSKEVSEVENFEVTNNGYGFVTYSVNELYNYSSSNDDLEGWDESWSQHEYCTDANGNVDYCSDIEDSDDTNTSNNDLEGWDESWSQHEYCTDANGNVDYCSDIETEESTEEQSEFNSDSFWEQYGMRYWSEVVEFDRTSESGNNFDWEKEMNSIGESALGYEYIMFTYSDSCVIVTNEPDPNYFFVTLDEAEQWRN